MKSLRAQLEEGLAGQYTIERVIGKGGMATVYLAKGLHPVRSVAIKVLDPDVSSLITRKRFLREIDLAGGLAHPHILPIFSAGETEDLLYFTMPHIPSDSLRQMIAGKGALTIPEAIRIAVETADALAYAHQNGIVHRDIKPENILISKGHAMVADFGIGKAYKEASDLQLTQSGVALGTPTYMSPEQARGAEIGPESDIYSLGCVLFEMLTGSPPFSGNSAHEIMNHHTKTPAPTPRSRHGAIPAAVLKAVATCLEKKPEKRFTNAEELANSIRKEVALSAIRTGPGQRNKGKLLTTLVASIVLLVGSVIWRTMYDTAAPGIFVAALDNQTGSPELGEIGIEVANSLAAELEMAGGGQNSLGHATSLRVQPTRDALLKTAAELGARIIIHGSYYIDSDTMRFQIVITDATSGTIVGAPEPVNILRSNTHTAGTRLSRVIAPILEARFGRPKSGLGSGTNRE
jgi:tRNA A-37 threonylcarbamoyl transferase component Bud32